MKVKCDECGELLDIDISTKDILYNSYSVFCFSCKKTIKTGINKIHKK